MSAHTTVEADERLEVLETKVAYQEQTIDALNEVVTEQRDLVDRMQREIDRMRQTLDTLAPGEVDAEDEPPPPHY